jgi:uncharacterized protein YggL (DUF469 family)
MTDLVLCTRCETLEKNGIKRRDLFYSVAPSSFGKCKQCHEEKISKLLKQRPDKTLEILKQLKKQFGGKNGKSSKSLS